MVWLILGDMHGNVTTGQISHYITTWVASEYNHSPHIKLPISLRITQKYEHNTSRQSVLPFFRVFLVQKGLFLELIQKFYMRKLSLKLLVVWPTSRWNSMFKAKFRKISEIISIPVEISEFSRMPTKKIASS